MYNNIRSRGLTLIVSWVGVVVVLVSRYVIALVVGVFDSCRYLLFLTYHVFMMRICVVCTISLVIGVSLGYLCDEFLLLLHHIVFKSRLDLLCWCCIADVFGIRFVYLGICVSHICM